jgi:hypothetical protein
MEACSNIMTDCSEEMGWFLEDFSLDMWVRDFRARSARFPVLSVRPD